MCYEKIVFFQKLNSLRILSRFLIENNLYLIKNIRRENKTIEKIVLPQVYLKQSRYKIEVQFILEGNKFQDRFLNLGSTLEVMFKRGLFVIKLLINDLSPMTLLSTA